MDINGGSSDDRARLQIYTANNSQAQMFTFKQVGNGLYEIVNVNSGKPLRLKEAPFPTVVSFPNTLLMAPVRSIGLLLTVVMASIHS
ncbi:MAG: RICIN domain-containing protein [Collinsella sp.]